ncbi:Neuromedin-U receptor 2 [Orchesella cincta]|uniref:Neuromedin-U receptor 2 n=1 Tax=Orchesella cincta TaxID=48709 RepID=A0A1D2N7Z8_ORCCI|nr:Neuromedin-U receptor 2 [Orchesella cincta]
MAWKSEKQALVHHFLQDSVEEQGERMMLEQGQEPLQFSSSMELGFPTESYNSTSQQDYEENYLEKYLGPKHLPFSSLIPITVIYSLIFVTGIFGNLSTCLVIAKAHYMRSSTNYYLFNLAIADMLTLIFEIGISFPSRDKLIGLSSKDVFAH